MRKRRGIVLFLVFAMLLTTFGAVFAEEEVTAVPTKPTENERVNALIEDGLVLGDANGYRLSETITRAEVISMLVRLQGKQDVAATMQSMPGQFTDVDSNHWANGDINYAAAMNLTYGFPDKTFRPSALISNSEVIALLTRVSGQMTVEEDESAIWPVSYIVKASEVGILKDVTVPGYADHATREQTFEMIYNAIQLMDVKPEIETVGNPVEVLVVENKRIGKMDENKVGVIAIKDQYIKNEGLVAGDTFEIDLTKIHTEVKVDSEEILGKVLKVYFNAKGEPVKMNIDESYNYVEGLLTNTKTDEIEISKDKFDVVTDKDGRLDRVLSLAIYNNRKVDFDGSRGLRTLVDNNEFVRATVKNGNVLFVETLDFLDIAPVSEVKENDIFYIDNNRSGLERKLTVKEKDLVVMKYKDGLSEGKLADIKKNDIIHWFADKSDKMVIIVISSEDAKTEGTFKGVSFSNRADREPVIEIGEKEITALVANGNFSPVYSTLTAEGKYYSLTQNYLSELEGFHKEEAVAYTDIFGNLQKLVGDEEVETRFVSVITDTFYREYELALGTGEIDYYEVTRSTKFYKTVDNKVVRATENEFNKYDLVRVLADGNKIVEIEKLTDSERVITNINKNVVDFGSKFYYIDSNTSIFTLDMNNVERSEVMTVAGFLSILDKTKTIKGYVLADERNGEVAEHIVITEFGSSKTANVDKSIVEITRIRAEGSNYLVTVKDQDGTSVTHLIEDRAEVVKIKNNSLMVGDVVEIVTEKKTEEFVEMNLVLNDEAAVYYISRVGRGGSRNLNFIVLEDKNRATKTIWVAASANVFGNYDEGSRVMIGEVDDYGTIALLKVVAKNKDITGVWATEDELKVEDFVKRLNALPTVEKLSVKNKEELVAVRTFYRDTLTEEQRAMVTVGDLDKLVELENKMTVLEAKETDRVAIKKFIDALNLIPETVTEADAQLVTDARTAYEGLTTAQAGMITVADYAKLTNAESIITKIGNDKAKALEFKEELDKLPAIDELSLGNKQAVVDVRAMFDGLTEDQAAYVNQADKDLLVQYEAKIVELEG